MRCGSTTQQQENNCCFPELIRHADVSKQITCIEYDICEECLSDKILTMCVCVFCRVHRTFYLLTWNFCRAEDIELLATEHFHRHSCCCCCCFCYLHGNG